VSRALTPALSGTTLGSNSRGGTDPLFLPSEDRAYELIRRYFSDTGTIFPFIDEQRIFNAYKNAIKNGFTSVSRSQLCILNLVFAFATFLNSGPEQVAGVNAAESEAFYQRALVLSTSSRNLHFADVETGWILLSGILQANRHQFKHSC